MPRYAQIISTGRYLPEKVRTNAEIETILPSRATFVVGPRALVDRRAEVAVLVSRLAAKVGSSC